MTNENNLSISWVILTYNRAEMVRKAFEHNADNAGSIWNELIWVDNGSKDHVREVLMPYADVAVLNSTNLGVAKGYNRGMGLATKEYIVITGCDVLMPKNWLRTFRQYIENIPQTGVACIYTCDWTAKSERIRRFGLQYCNDLPYVEAMPIERRIFKRSLLADFGYFPETFGLYGYDDMAWAYRAEKVCADKGLITYVIPGQVGLHMGTEGVKQADGKDDAEYHAFKAKEVMNFDKKAELARLRDLGWPKFTPFP